jgi:hypothetical protein
MTKTIVIIGAIAIGGYLYYANKKKKQEEEAKKVAEKMKEEVKVAVKETTTTNPSSVVPTNTPPPTKDLTSEIKSNVPVKPLPLPMIKAKTDVLNTIAIRSTPKVTPRVVAISDDIDIMPTRPSMGISLPKNSPLFTKPLLGSGGRGGAIME